MRTLATRLSVMLTLVSSTALAQPQAPASAAPKGRPPTPRAAFLPTAPAESCAPVPASAGVGATNAQVWLDRAAVAILPTNSRGKVLRIRSYNDQVLWEQSDRMYEPFIPNMQGNVRWYDLQTSVEGKQPQERPAGAIPATVLSTPRAVFVTRDTSRMPVPQLYPFSEPERQLNPWAVLQGWQQSTDVRIAERCLMREYPRVVLARSGAHGDEHLYIDEYSAVPVQLSRTEAHYLWGQVRADYQWSTWQTVDGGGRFPYSANRLFDGHLYGRQSNPTTQLIPADSAPRLTVPANVAAMSTALQTFPGPDTVRVSANTFLLVNRAYTNVVTLQKDTVFVLDATSNEDRSRADSVWIGKLFPGRHPIVIVVTDLAWPHISGVRFWTAGQAPIVTHALSTSFLQRVVDRRWTLAPDKLEQQRAGKRTAVTFRVVRDSLRLAGGALVVHPIQGVASEGAVLVSIPGERFVWAGDYLQQVDKPTQYAGEVLNTLTRLGISPDRVAAQHLPLTKWEIVVKANGGDATTPRGGIFH